MTESIFANQLVRCSAINMIMTKSNAGITEKQLATLEELNNKAKLTDKQAELLLTLLAKQAESEVEPLSDTCKSYLLGLYAYAKYGRRFSISKDGIKQLVKGKMVEEESITLLCELDKKFYQKNEERITNDYISGIPDLYEGSSIYIADYVIDIKSSWDLETFLPNLLAKDVNKAYWWQLQGYMALTGATKGKVSHCLVSTPDQLINDAKRQLMFKMNVATDQNPEYLEASAELELNMIFDDIPKAERKIDFPVERDDYAIEKIYRRVEKCREWLIEFEQLHNNLIIAAQ